MLKNERLFKYNYDLMKLNVYRNDLVIGILDRWLQMWIEYGENDETLQMFKRKRRAKPR